MKKIILLLCVVILSSCSVYKAANQEEAKDLSVLQLNNSRILIIGELGNPASSETNAQGYKIDTYSLVNGYSAASRSARAVGHGVADVFTLGLWEVAGTPIEGGFNGTKVNGQAVYNNEGRAIKLEFYEDGKPLVNLVSPEFTTPAAVIAPAPEAVAPAAATPAPAAPTAPAEPTK